MIIFFLILTTLIDQLCDKSIYRPYLRLMTGFMLISLMMQPISYYLSNEDIVTQAISTAVKGENNPAFLDGAKEEKQNQIKEQITTLFSQYDLKVLDVDSKVNEKGTIEKIDIKTDKLRHTKKLKTAISNFFVCKFSFLLIIHALKPPRFLVCDNLRKIFCKINPIKDIIRGDRNNVLCTRRKQRKGCPS